MRRKGNKENVYIWYVNKFFIQFSCFVTHDKCIVILGVGYTWVTIPKPSLKWRHSVLQRSALHLTQSQKAAIMVIFTIHITKHGVFGTALFQLILIYLEHINNLSRRK